MGFFSFLKKLFKRVVNALVAAAVAFVVTLITSGGNLGTAFGVATGTFFKELGFPSKRWKPPFGTPPTFPVGTGRPALHQIFQGTILSGLFPSPQSYLRWVNGWAGGAIFDAGGINQGRVDACSSFANTVAGIAAAVSRDQFLNHLARTFIGVADSSLWSMQNAGTTRAPTNYNSSGFQGQFVDPTDPRANQVRHYVAGLIYGARVGRRFALWRMNARETPGASDYRADTALNAVSTRHGANLRDPRDLAGWIRRDVCK